MPAGKYNGFLIEQGADFAPGEITWKDANETPINLTGYTARMDIKKDVNSSAIITLTTENGRITLGGAAGTIALTIVSADTDALPVGNYKYDMELVSGSGTVTRLLEGSVSVKENITA